MITTSLLRIEEAVKVLLFYRQPKWIGQDIFNSGQSRISIP
jgi:hypothetical protein